MYWSDIAYLDHASQVDRFGWCGCEEGTAVYDDCPVEPEPMRIDGTITDSKGVVTHFSISNGIWNQWGATTDTLGERVELLERLTAAVTTGEDN